MEVIRGYNAVRSRLSRRVGISQGEISPRIRSRIQAIFGKDLTPEQAVRQIIEDIRTGGDAALKDYMLKIDGVNLSSFEIDINTIKEAYHNVAPELISALQTAARRILEFHQAQKENVWKGVSGEDWRQLIRPLNRVGLYAPGGTAPYPSTILMITIPARVAGVKEIILATPPGPNGMLPPVTLVAADIAGAHRVFSISGAQAIAAMAYGTDSIPRVDKICGPGNIFVALAKKAVFGEVDIDAIQGPSEILIIADDSSHVEYCAADLLSQAEHDTQAQAILLTTSETFASHIIEELNRQIATLPRKNIVAESLENNGVIGILDTLEEAIELANLYAPEHLELAIQSAEHYLDKITCAGCIFLGENSAEAIGDYVAGPNHSLPTGGTARFSSPLNILDFMKITNVVRINQPDLEYLGKAAITIARAEGFEAHARAVEKRLQEKSQ